MFNIAICDDEKYYREKIEELVTKYFSKKDIEICISRFESGEKLCQEGIKLSKYDLIFLDINMGDIDGLDTAKKIRNFNSEVYIVFVTAFINYVLEGYKVDAIRYLLKDSLENSMDECLDAVTEKNKGKVEKITLPFIEGKKQVLIEKIFYIESQKHKLFFHILEDDMKKYTLYDKLDNLEEQLAAYGFLRIHKSYLVNIKHIEKINNYKAILTSGENLPIPKLKYQMVKEEYVLFKGDL